MAKADNWQRKTGNPNFKLRSYFHRWYLWTILFNSSWKLLPVRPGNRKMKYSGNFAWNAIVILLSLKKCGTRHAFATNYAWFRWSVWRSKNLSFDSGAILSMFCVLSRLSKRIETYRNVVNLQGIQRARFLMLLLWFHLTKCELVRALEVLSLYL